MRYALVTPARDDAENLVRLAESIERQTLLPDSWVIVDDGSSDGTAGVIAGLQARLPSVVGAAVPQTQAAAVRGGPIVRAFREGLDRLPRQADVVIKLDADLSMEPDYFERLIAAFAADPALGIASGSCWERDAGGVWRQRFGTRDGVWGACRAYRWACLQDVLPLEERQGWDEIDSLMAAARNWRTGTILDLPFRHHRVEGARDRSRLDVWAAQGEASYYIGYRPSYAFARALFRGIREPAAFAIAGAYIASAVRRGPRCQDQPAVDYLREQQRLRRLPQRAREALGKGAGAGSAPIA